MSADRPRSSSIELEKTEVASAIGLPPHLGVGPSPASKRTCDAPEVRTNLSYEPRKSRYCGCPPCKRSFGLAGANGARQGDAGQQQLATRDQKLQLEPESTDASHPPFTVLRTLRVSHVQSSTRKPGSRDCPRPPAGGPGYGPGATTDSSTRGAAEISSRCLLNGRRRGCHPHGRGPRKADVSRARQPATAGHRRPTWCQTAPASPIQAHGFGLQMGCRQPFPESRGGLAEDDFPANQWWTAAGSNR